MKQILCTLVAALVLILFLPHPVTAQYAYVTNANSASVSVVNTATNSVTATVNVGRNPTGSAVNAAGTRVYVANQSDGTVSVIDTANNTVNALVRLGAGVDPFGIAVNPSGSFVYTANQSDNTVSVINTATNVVIATVPENYPSGVVVNPSGTRVYVTNSLGSTVSVIDTATNLVTATVAVGSGPFGVAVNPTGTRVYTANNGFAGSGNTVSVIDTNTNTEIATVKVGQGVRGIAVNSSGTRAYATNTGGGGMGGGVSVIDTTTNLVTATVSLGDGYGVAVNPAGTFVYVTHPFTSTLSVVNTATNTLVAAVPVGSSSFNLGQFVGGPANLSIKPNGIVNSASFAANTPIAPGSLASVYGTFPANTAQATGVPLPFALSGLSIQVGGIRAPLQYVSATQVNVQIPWELTGQTQATVVATTSSETSTPVNVTLATFAPGVFLVNAQGQGAITDAFTGQLIGPSNPAKAGSTIAIYCTGLGPVANQPLTGDAASIAVLSGTIHPTTVIIGGVPAVPIFSGLAPTFVGLYQINVQIPPGVPVGDAVPLVVTFNGTNSNTATIAIR
jgi:uncharacterized protein (TIGR03437 family)